MDTWDKQSWNQKIIPKKQKVVMSKSAKIIYGAFFIHDHWEIHQEKWQFFMGKMVTNLWI